MVMQVAHMQGVAASHRARMDLLGGACQSWEEGALGLTITWPWCVYARVRGCEPEEGSS